MVMGTPGKGQRRDLQSPLSKYTAPFRSEGVFVTNGLPSASKTRQERKVADQVT